jgi:hypothetical protein
VASLVPRELCTHCQPAVVTGAPHGDTSSGGSSPASPADKTARRRPRRHECVLTLWGAAWVLATWLVVPFIVRRFGPAAALRARRHEALHATYPHRRVRRRKATSATRCFCSQHHPPSLAADHALSGIMHSVDMPRPSAPFQPPGSTYEVVQCRHASALVLC